MSQANPEVRAPERAEDEDASPWRVDEGAAKPSGYTFCRFCDFHTDKTLQEILDAAWSACSGGEEQETLTPQEALNLEYPESLFEDDSP